jgi:hypothetical protein
VPETLTHSTVVPINHNPPKDYITFNNKANIMFRSIILLCCAIAAVQSFSVAPVASRTSTKLHLQQFDDASVVSRRSAMATGLAAAFAVALPVAAFADESADDIVKRIAAKSAVANEAARAKALDEEKKKEEGKDAGKLLVPAFLLGGVGLTLPFFLPNLIRLGKKTSSLGEDDGYGNKKR